MKYKLQDLIDMEHFQTLQDRLNEIYSFPSSIIDNDGNILTATAWQDICTQFHRKNKDCEKLCIKSDQYIKDHIHEASLAVTYRCPHGLVDNAMPIIIDGFHYGNFFTGQFFLEEPDIGFFLIQAKKYGFDEDSYLKAVKRVPIWTQEQLNNYLFFIKGLIAVISESGMKKLKEIENRQLIEASEKRQKSILKSAMDGYWLTDTEGWLLEVNDAYCRMSGYSEDELLTMHVPDFEAVEDPQLVIEHMQRVISQGSDRFESKHRRKDGTVFQVEVSIQFRPEEGGQCVCFLRDITERKQAEQTLKNNHDLNERIMETSPSGIIRVDAIGKIIYANKRAETILGINLSKTKTRTYNDPAWKIVGFDGELVPEESLPFNIVKNTGVPVFGIQHAIEWPDGNKIYLSINASPLFDNNRDFDGIVASVEDISEKFISEQKYQILFNEMINGFALHEIIIDDKGLPIDYRFLDVNPAFERLTNLKRESLVGKTVLEVMPKTESSWIEKYGQVALTGKSIMFENYSQELDRYYQVAAFRPTQNQFACIFVDITKRQQTENTLRDREQKYKSLFDQSNDGIFLHDLKGNIIDTNLKANKMLGYKQGELNQLSLQILHPDYEAETSRQAFEQTKSKGQFVFETKFIKKDGSIIDIDISSSIVDQKKGIVQGIVRDITERKKMEKQVQQSQKMESIGTLASGIAHDFNNILFPIVGHAEMLLEDTPEDSPFQDGLNAIYTSALRAKDLVKQILTFSRQESGELKLMKTQPIIKEALKLIRSTIPTTIDIKQYIRNDCGIIKADPTQIHQIVMNLATNAYHAMEKTGGELKVSLKEIELGELDLINPDMTPGVYACLTVADTGKGMDKALTEKIFDPFFTTKEKGKGTGMGLSVVHGIVISMNGAIQVYSEPGKGTVFNVYLPVEKSFSTEPITNSNVKIQTGTEQILLVDDEAAIITMEKQMLERLGYQVTSRTSSIEALEAFRSSPDKFDLVITDMAMPNMPGDKLSAEFIKLRADIPILLCTGFSDTMSEEKATSLGIKGFLLKPTVMKDLSQKIREVLDENKV